ncbi:MULTISPECIES: ATP-binding protein [unclassified Legionella]|uniref:PAS domain-containing sensor histidine kinase n=1 Tax=unclassified Legionella TaxID=2622702 RepID=UPI0010544D7B|nr:MULTISPECIES: ATP-binding protein [unclassified Legionella]MDI9819229.1 ATP-binding protein [Legionella sp. PL877]
MEIHKLLKRQLNRANITIDKLPADIEKWQEFILRINKTYQEADQERYFLDRSMAISSREMMMLNEKLERAQHIAQLCYWQYDDKTERIIWSKEFYELVELSHDAAHTFDAFLQLVHPKERIDMENHINKALQEHISYVYELRLKNCKGQYKWYRIVARYEKEEKALSGVLIDIDQDKKNEGKIKELSKKLLITAHQAGMSEIATSILHNIGNILNSSNISINLIKESFEKPYYQKFCRIIEMIKENLGEINRYLTEDEKGKLIPEYLIHLSDLIANEHQENKKEIVSLDRDLQHIKDIVSIQNTFSGMSGIHERVFIPELMETALQMSTNTFEDKLIEIHKHCIEPHFVFTDKSKLLQILVNLIKNAKEAVLKNAKNKSKKIEIVVKAKKNKINILVKDNGVGILPENLERIFSFGFTTKPQGHGFGLHSSALSAKEMGGALEAQSLGIGLGSVFILTLPAKSAQKSKGVFNE